jgi:hypothetical protein
LISILTIFALSTVTDVVLEQSGFMKLPFDSNPLWLKIFVTAYRNVFVVAGAYLTARLAPASPLKHVIALACIGFVLGVAGAVVMWHEPPHWYPIALIILGVPSTLFGGWLFLRRPGKPYESQSGA